MTYHLPPHISFGPIGARAVLLDLRADRYFLLGEAEAAAMGPAGASDAGRSREDMLERLADRGFLGIGPGAVVRPVEAPALARSALESGKGAEPVSLWEVGAARYGAALALRRTGLARTIETWRSLRTRRGLAPPCDAPRPNRQDEAAALARGYAAARLFVPTPKLCIPDSLALARMLWKRGLAADLYFGVQLAPFTAHCWVQQGDLLLSDPLGKVAEFAPVFRL